MLSRFTSFASLKADLADAPTIPDQYLCQNLNGSHVLKVHNLHNLIWNRLPEAQKNFVVQKTPEHFAQFFGDKGQTLGVLYSSGELVACATVALPSRKNPKHDLVDDTFLESLGVKPEQVAILQSDAVHPDHRQHGLHRYMILNRCYQARFLSRDYAVAEIAKSNKRSLDNYLSCGFQQVAESVDPQDNCQLVYVAKRLPRLAVLSF